MERVVCAQCVVVVHTDACMMIYVIACGQVSTMMALAHENVAQAYTTIQAHGCTYLVMEIIAGGELFDTVHRQTFSHKYTHMTRGTKHARTPARGHTQTNSPIILQSNRHTTENISKPHR